MSDVMKIDGYEAMVISVGYIFAGEVAPTMWEAAAYHECDGSRLINVENAIDALENSETPLEETDQKLLSLCKAAHEKGLQDIIINVS